MDQATREERRRAKAVNGRRGDLPSIGPRAYGRKGGVERTANKRCSHIVGGKKHFIPVKRNNPQPGERKVGFIVIIKGGVRCCEDVLANGKCLAHLGKEDGE